ncbi:MAG TPA: hypothetical protein VN661_02240 [Candidatus Acidoferrales bacterium]|nr:hypothetical protein [Candidatus Acidoferrales bacterium]
MSPAGRHVYLDAARDLCPRIPAGTRRRERGSTFASVLLALLLSLLVLITVWIFAARVFPAPSSITAIGDQVDRQYALTLWITGAIFVLAQLGFAWAILRFRDRGQRARFVPGNSRLEFAWTVAAIILFLGLGVLGRRAWAESRFTPPSAGAIQVEVTESQFVFNFRYPGPDGKFGRLDPRLISPSTGNPLGLDDNDPAARDDVVVPQLTVPVNRQIALLIRSQDVVHNFFVRELRLQEDAVPGMIISVHFTPDRLGRYEIVCTQLCGLGHYRMHSYLNVVAASDYQAFLNQQQQALRQ